MTHPTVKPEHWQSAYWLIGAALNEDRQVPSNSIGLAAQLYADLDQARADARVLAEEVEFVRDVIHGGYRQYMAPGTLQEWRALWSATDASGALERNK